jgi:chemotaxis protein MotB
MGKKKQILPADESFEMTFIALMLLLFCFMVIMVSLAQLEGPRFRRAIGSVRGALSMLAEAGGTSMVGDGGPGVLPARGNRGGLAEYLKQVEELETSLERLMGEDTPEGMVRVEATESGLMLSLGSLALFDKGGADLTSEARPVLAAVADFLVEWPGEIEVTGHTCDLPIHTEMFPSNWDLSIARAIAVVRFFRDQGIEGERLLAIGRGESQPIVANDVEENRALNRRVEIGLEFDDDWFWEEGTETQDDQYGFLNPSERETPAATGLVGPTRISRVPEEGVWG